MTAAARNRRYRERLKRGVVRMEVELDRLWWAEALWQGGFLTNPDEDARLVLQAATQNFLETVIEVARDEGRVAQGPGANRYIRGRSNRKDPKP